LLLLSINTNFVVVEPASIPTKQSPLYVSKSKVSTFALSCLSLNSLYSTSFLNNGSIGFVVVSLDIFKNSIFLFNC